MLYDNCPKIDLHGYDRDYALILVKEFINDNIKLDKRIIVIVNGGEYFVYITGLKLYGK